MIKDNNDLLERLVIINDCDCPEARLVCFVGSDGIARYIHACFEKRLKDFQGGVTESTQNLKQFGFRVMNQTQDGWVIRQIHNSEAKYPDGMIRNWQGGQKEITINEKMLINK